MTRSILQYSYDAGGNLMIGAPTHGVPSQILSQPVQQIVASGDIATFSVVVADTRGVTFQWKFNGTDIPGATGDSLLLTKVSTANEGQYSVVVMSSAGSVTSASASLILDSNDDGLPDSWGLLSVEPSQETPGYSLLLNGVRVAKAAALTSHMKAGIRLTVEFWVPQRDAQNGWWGVVRAGKSASKPAYTTASAGVFLLPPDQYDVYWKHDWEHEPLLLASSITLDHGQVAQVKASPKI